MTQYFIIEPEVAGGLGPHTEMDRSVHPPIVTKLHYVFDGWLGDEILETFPCHIVTRRLADRLSAANMSGVAFSSVEVSVSEEFEDVHPDVSLPEFVRLVPSGVAGVDDFGLYGKTARLVVSDRGLRVVQKTHPKQLLTKTFPA
jgi:hypothetical protein